MGGSQHRIWYAGRPTWFNNDTTGTTSLSGFFPHTLATLTQFHLYVHLSSPVVTTPCITWEPPPCSQKCWVLLFAFYAEIRWGCELSLSICSLEWRRRGERRGGEDGTVHGVHSTYVLCMFWVNIHTQTLAHTWANNYSNGCFVSCWTLY